MTIFPRISGTHEARKKLNVLLKCYRSGPALKPLAQGCDCSARVGRRGIIERLKSEKFVFLVMAE